MAVGEIIGPTFDSPLHVIVNLLGLGILLGAVMTVAFGLITRTRKVQWRDLLIGGTLSLGGVYIPLFPVAWIVGEVQRRSRIKARLQRERAASD